MFCQTNVVLLSELHNYTNLVYMVFVQHCYMFRLSTSALIRYKEILVHKKEPLLLLNQYSYLTTAEADTRYM